MMKWTDNICPICGDAEATEEHRATEHTLIALCFNCWAAADRILNQVMAHRRVMAAWDAEKLLNHDYKKSRIRRTW